MSVTAQKLTRWPLSTLLQVSQRGISEVSEVKVLWSLYLFNSIGVSQYMELLVVCAAFLLYSPINYRLFYLLN